MINSEWQQGPGREREAMATLFKVYKRFAAAAGHGFLFSSFSVVLICGRSFQAIVSAKHQASPAILPHPGKAGVQPLLF
ncbi:hypothetical protein [Fodinibius sediminis]|uniref:hypothetical protein n=1 Tax=Fodinibius sediminis TaxID=1214077 RepID=UPI00163D69CA|nr:hypothetical protein [Fodinibius sediminis]